MTKVLPLFVLLLSMSAFAKNTHTFNFDSLGYPCACATITKWDGVADKYPGDMGQISLNLFDNPYSGIIVPQAFGFPDNGDLPDNMPFANFSVPENVVWKIGNGQHVGDSGTLSGTAAYTGYGAGVTVSVTLTVTVSGESCRRASCSFWYSFPGGSGVASYEP